MHTITWVCVIIMPIRWLLEVTCISYIIKCWKCSTGNCSVAINWGQSRPKISFSLLYLTCVHRLCEQCHSFEMIVNHQSWRPSWPECQRHDAIWQWPFVGEHSLLDFDLHVRPLSRSDVNVKRHCCHLSINWPTSVRWPRWSCLPGSDTPHYLNFIKA